VIRIGTRGSALALVQAGEVAERLRALGATAELVPMRTEGDRRADARLATLGGKGLFVWEIEEALLDGTIDVAVHSLKDLPATLPAGLVLAAFPERADPRDVLVTRASTSFDALPRGARLGTSSPRRRSIALSLRPDLRVEPLRGNVDTRLRRLDSGDWDGIILAAAGLRRLGLTPAHAVPLDPAIFVPAVGQGILAVEARVHDRETNALLSRLQHRATAACALAERGFLAALGASCATPVAAHAVVADGHVRLTGIVLSEDGRELLRETADGPSAVAEEVGLGVAEALLARGAARVAALTPAKLTAHMRSGTIAREGDTAS
jgi:hydroxymethylbilane synthase